jgi:hypothetical protein
MPSRSSTLGGEADRLALRTVSVRGHFAPNGADGDRSCPWSQARRAGGSSSPALTGRCASPDGPGLDGPRAVQRRGHDRSPPADQPGSRFAADARQQRYLRSLAMQRGVSFTIPRTRAEASRLVDELRRQPADSVADRRREVRAVQNAMATGRGDAARVREELEVTGYGASAAVLTTRRTRDRGSRTVNKPQGKGDKKAMGRDLTLESLNGRRVRANQRPTMQGLR